MNTPQSNKKKGRNRNKDLTTPGSAEVAPTQESSKFVLVSCFLFSFPCLS